MFRWLARCRLTRAQRYGEAWLRDAAAMEQRLRRLLRRLETMRRHLESLSQATAEDAEDARLLIDRQDRVVRGLNDEVSLLNRTIAELIEQNQMVREEVKSSLAVQQRVQVTAIRGPEQ